MEVVNTKLYNTQSVVRSTIHPHVPAFSVQSTKLLECKITLGYGPVPYDLP